MYLVLTDSKFTPSVKYNDFTKSSRQTTIDTATDSGTEIYNMVKVLFEQLWNTTPVRLLGIRTTNLLEEKEPEQLSILDIINNQQRDAVAKPSREKIEKLDKALDAIKNKYGDDAVKRASLMKKEN